MEKIVKKILLVHSFVSLDISEAISTGFYSFVVVFLTVSKGLYKDYSLFNDGLVQKLCASF